MGKKQFKKTKLIFSIICIIALSVFVVVILIHKSKADKVVAKTFLTQYYTAADDTENMYKIINDINEGVSATQVELEGEIDDMIQCAYGTCVSSDTLGELMENNVLFAPDKLATRAGVSVTCMDIVLNEKTDTSQGKNDYTYSADVYIANTYGNCTQIVLEGVVKLEKEGNAWKVTEFYPDENIDKMQLQLKRPEESLSTQSRGRQIDCKTYGFAL